MGALSFLSSLSSSDEGTSQISPEEATGGGREGRERRPRGGARLAGAKGAGGSSCGSGGGRRGGRCGERGGDGVLRISSIILLKSDILKGLKRL